MKKLLLIMLICLGAQQTHAQDPDLFKTWGLYEVQKNDLDPVFIVANIDPPISPTLTISNILEFSGLGACNSFIGTYTYDGFLFDTTDFTSTSLICLTIDHDFFEEAYFGLLNSSFWYTIIPTSEGLILRFDSPLGGYALLADHELSVDDSHLNRIALFPNPVSETLFFTSEGTPIQSIVIYSIPGKRILSGTASTNQIDVSSLKAGIYFAEITTSEGKNIQKFIKE